MLGTTDTELPPAESPKINSSGVTFTKVGTGELSAPTGAEKSNEQLLRSPSVQLNYLWMIISVQHLVHVVKT